MKILIATGIYPPEIGGPAQYAYNLEKVWTNSGHSVSVQVFSKFNYLPTGIRHLAFFYKIIPNVLTSDFILVLDTYSAALPVLLASIIFRKKIIIRTGGDFLWETYVERTGDLVLLRDFYETRLGKLSLKEKVIFNLTRGILQGANAIIWSTEWQKNIFTQPYNLFKSKHFIVENNYSSHLKSYEPTKKNFIASTRKLKWKNIDALKRVFSRDDVIASGAVLEIDPVEHSKFMDVISGSYAVIIASLGDISPNTILDAIKYEKPFIVTEETGLTSRINNVSIFINPKDEDDIAKKIIWLCNDENYKIQKQKIEAFQFTHTWEQIAEEYLDIYNKIK